jgi:hypothetical protein
MLELDQVERVEILNSFQEVIDTIRVDLEVSLFTAECKLRQGKLAEASILLSQADHMQLTLTSIRSYLEYKYRQTVSLH